jgi:hypothetical protein
MSCLGWALLRLAERERGVWGVSVGVGEEGETVVCLPSAMQRYAIHHVMKHWCALGAQSTAAPESVPEEGKESKKQARQGGVLQLFTFHFFNVENSRCGQVDMCFFLDCRN